MILFIIGILSGIVSGMGIGGGTILIPALSLFTNLNQHQSQGISLFVFIPTAIVALITHFFNKNIQLKTAAPIILSGIIGALIGSSLAVMVSDDLLRKMFGIFLFFMGLYEIFSKVKE
ncbi:protein of unknown function DUF81 [Gottschalkia purinilytica]|uniref:Probable membrane transporter protein n=1 Tax=Gottschalkia purinilytica TaxID=1503 RepID=A0A0L0WCQ5_GOTPU|nr:sulfite exporter TauE/SafE family protein [Gottschalkia purinilytica]KNF09248.1 protein of unknown function DUF81 [Gottschalkia purinilytica]